MAGYRHTQKGNVIIVITVVAMIVLAVALRFLPVVLVIAESMLAIVLLLFARLTVTVDAKAVRCQFGPGPLRIAFDLRDIRATQIVRNRWWYGWGIRLTPHGWMWNCSGLDAVLIIRAKGKSFVIGTDDPQGLRRAIDAAIAQSHRDGPTILAA